MRTPGQGYQTATLRRRSFLLASAGLPLALANMRAVGTACADEQPVVDDRKGSGVTRTLAHYVVNARYEDLPADVQEEGLRTLLNWVRGTIGGSREPAVDIAVSALLPISGQPQANSCGLTKSR